MIHRILLAVLLVAGGLIGLGEAVARFGLGLGTPPLTVPHATVEYMFRPGQDVQRFGNRQLYNAHGMRGADLNGGPLVLVFGDSVLNGGNLTDQADLAMEQLSARPGAPRFANVSAGSWGPANQLAYVQSFGTFGAQAAIVVLNAEDIDDLPDFDPLNPNTHPVTRPPSALWEAISRYLPRYLPQGLTRVLAPGTTPHPYADTPRPGHANGAAAGRALIADLARRGLPVCLVLHPTQRELGGQPHPGKAAFQDLATTTGTPVVDMAPMFARQPQPVAAFYRDNIHINAAGQRILADAIWACHGQAALPHMGKDAS